MTHVLCHQSAFEYYCAARYAGLIGKADEDCYCVPAGLAVRLLSAQPDLQECGRMLETRSNSLTSPLHVAVTDASMRRTNKSVAFHVLKGENKRGLLLRAPVSVGAAHDYMCSPALTLAQLSLGMTRGKLALAAFEWCGAYACDRSLSSVGEGFVGVPPLISVGNIKTFARYHSEIRGCDTLARVMRYVADGSASPMESALVILLCFPVKWGGYGLPLPQLNKPIALPKKKQTAARKTFFAGDLLWPSKKLIVEYDSDAFHVGHSRISEDSLRRNFLADMGYTVVSVTSDQVFQVLKTDELARQLLKHLGIRKREPKGNWVDEKLKLRADVL